MNVVIVTRHKYHIVRSLQGCTVRQEGANGTVIETTVPADEDTPVFAHSGKWTIEGDDNVTVTEVFKLAPIAFGGGGKPGWYDVLRSELAELLGAGNFSLTYAWKEDKFTLTLALPLDITDDQMAQVRVLLGRIPPRNLVTEFDPFPSDFTRLGYLESSKSQFIYLDGEFNSTAAWRFSFTPTKIESNNYFCGRNEYGYAFAKIVNNLVAIGYVPGNNYVGFEPSTQEVYTANFDMLNKRGFISRRGEKKEWIFTDVPDTKALVLFGGQATNESDVKNVSYKSQAKMWDIAVSHNEEKTHEFVPAIDSDGEPCMFDTVTRKPFRNDGTGKFIAGVETQKQLDAVLRGLPDRTGMSTGALQVRLAADLQTDANRAAMDAVAAKNWEITEPLVI